ncbi:hypothetical protein MSC49_39190 (plasmid) [Methylosinus sp. C49]|nr:hypothetical protein MSC49_39190 [Methylosinus sp. C49]
MTMKCRSLVVTFDETPQLGLFGDREAFEIESPAMFHSSDVARPRAEHDDTIGTKLDAKAGHGDAPRSRNQAETIPLLCANFKFSDARNELRDAIEPRPR